jgi:K(+)-stimulated pyrophosphate-energized sodium pump
MSLPLLVGGVCIITSIIGTYMVRLGSGSIMGALYKGFWTSALLAIPAIWWATHYALGDLIRTGHQARGPKRIGPPITGMSLFWCMMIGLAVTGAARVDHRILYRHQLSPGEIDRQGQRDRATAPT